MRKLKDLKSKRLIYEPLGLNHLSQDYVNWMNDEDVIRYMESGGDYSLDKLKDFLKDQENKEIFFLAIKIADSKKHIGNIKIDPIDTNNKSGEYGIMIGDKSEWGKGFAIEASETIIAYCFNKLGLNQINLGVDELNLDAIKLYKRLGFLTHSRKRYPELYKDTKEGILRMSKHRYHDNIILGTAQFGLDYGINNSKGKISDEEIYEILDHSYKSGIRKLDTAELYGNSNELIGEFHRNNPQKKFKVFSKATYGKGYIDYSSTIINNLKKLYIDNYEGYMIHSYKSFKDDPKLIDEIVKAKQDHLTNKIGISLYLNDEVSDVIDKNIFDFIQLPFNLLDNSNKREYIIKTAKSFNIEIFVRSIFLQGLIFKTQSLIPENLQPLKKYINQLNKICKDYNIEIDELAIKYVLEKQYINEIIFGVDSIDQLKRNLFIIESMLSVPSKKIDKINVMEKEFLNPTNW